MSEFTEFKKQLRARLNVMSKREFFQVDISKEEIWDTYLNSFPEGTNPIYKERTEHDCNCCKQFIRGIGRAVIIVGHKVQSIWGGSTHTGEYAVVAKALDELVRSRAIKHKYFHYQHNVGTDFNHQDLGEGGIKKWEHFYYKLPNKFVLRGDRINSLRGERTTFKDVFKRGLDEITRESIDIVTDLIEQNSLYRGEEHLARIIWFRTHKTIYEKLKTDAQKDTYAWERSYNGKCKIRNTSIGTLLVDLSNGVELDQAVKSFETKVAGPNYRRPTALVSKGMIDALQKEVETRGIMNSFPRRHATKEDITVNNVIFADRSIKAMNNIFDEMKANSQDKKPDLSKIEEVTIDHFIKKIVPNIDSIELLLENKHTSNLMTLVAPVYGDAPPILSWDNNYSWTYNGDVTDSIKERVKKAGGNVQGYLRFSLKWFNTDDYDAHAIEPDGHHIFHGAKVSSTSGQLDVDMNAGERHTNSPVENIVWTVKSKVKEGAYHFYVNNYTKRNNEHYGFEAEIEFDGKTYHFVYDKFIKNQESVTVAKFNLSKTNGLTFTESLPSTELSKEVWNVNTNNFHNVQMVMNSPNHWDDNKIGNKHWFFILDKAQNPEPVRGFFNEFMITDLAKHRKALETMGSKMKAPFSEQQLSGVGFSSTVRNSVVCRVKGTFNRTLKIKF